MLTLSQFYFVAKDDIECLSELLVFASWVLGLQDLATLPTLCGAEEGIQGFVHARQALY